MDIYNVTFVSLIESKDELGLYWYGSQFHPEKPMYEFAKNIPKSIEAMYSNQYFAEFFVNECRLRNNNKMNNELYQQNNLYNFNPYYTALVSDNEYAQMYLFLHQNDKLNFYSDCVWCLVTDCVVVFSVAWIMGCVIDRSSNK